MISIIFNNIMNKNLNAFMNKKRFIFSFAILIFISSFVKIYGQLPEELMRQGNKFYQSGQFETAVEAYEKVLSQGFESSALYYNLGNAFFKEGKIGSAILNYEKGLKLSPGDEDLSYNLRIANARTVDKISEVPQLFLTKWWDVLITSFSVTAWSFIVLIVYLVFIACIGLYLLSKKFKMQKMAFLFGSASLSVLIFSIIILVSRYNREAFSSYGVLLEANYTVKSGPDIKSNDAFVIHEGIKFIVEDKVTDWYKIRLVDGKVGWVQGKSFAEI
jgi:tetratricopeptide (TPR) repeat protein